MTVQSPPRTFSFLCTGCDQPVSVPAHPPAVNGTLSQSTRCSRCGHAYSWVDGVLMLGRSEDPDNYPEDLHALLAAVEPRHFWFGVRNRLIVATMTDVLGPLAGRSVLDVGCGTGFVLAALERAGMIGCGLDMNLAGLRYARQRTRGLLLCEDAARVPFTAQFDVAMLCDVIEHTPDDIAVLGETMRALGPGGALVVTVPAYPRLWTPLDDASGHKRRYTSRTLTQAMQRAGLHVRLVRTFNTLLLPIQLLERARFRSWTPTSEAERLDLVRHALRVPPAPLNTLLRLVMQADLPLRRLGLPFGTSLIAIGFRPG